MKLLAKEQIQLGFQQAEIELQQLHTRTKQGIETTRLNGKQIGQKSGSKLNVKKSAPAKAAILKYSKHFNGTLNDKECMLLAKISRGTFYRHKAELLAEQEQLHISNENKEKYIMNTIIYLYGIQRLQVHTLVVFILHFPLKGM